MVVLIGAGGHADDIAETTTVHRQFGHHLDWSDRDGNCIIGINDPWLREKVAAELGVRDLAWVHPDAKLYHGVTYGHGTHINYGVSAVRTTIGSHCTIAPGVTICGDVTIGDGVFIGAGAVIKNLVTIGDDAFVCMGAVVTRDVKRGEKYRGPDVHVAGVDSALVALTKLRKTLSELDGATEGRAP